MKKLIYLFIVLISLKATGQQSITVSLGYTTATTYSTVTEQKKYYNNEFYWNHGLNSSTGAFTSDATKDISDYIPCDPSTSITISTTDSSLITIYGWTYASDLTPISEIRSNVLISSLLKTYTFTTPSNAAYLAIYTKAANDSFSNRLRIFSTNSITYTVPITPDQFTGTSATDKINKAIKFQHTLSSPLYIRGQQDLDSALIYYSGTSIICDGCKLKMKYGMHDNIFRGEAVVQPSTHIFARGNRNVKITGVGKATLQGSTEVWGGESQTGLGTEKWRMIMVQLSNLENFEVSGFTLKAMNYWGIVLEQCRIGTLKNLTAEGFVEHPNQTIIQPHRGSHGILIDNITGNTGDDFIAIENLPYNPNTFILGMTIYEPYRSNLDIYDINIKNIIRGNFVGVLAVDSSGAKLYRSAIRILTSDGMKVHDCTFDGIYGRQEIFIQDYNSGYVVSYNNTVNDLYNIHVTNANCPIYVYRPIKNSSFINVPDYDYYGVYPNLHLPNGCLNIYRQFNNASPEFIDSVSSGIEHKRTLN